MINLGNNNKNCTSNSCTVMATMKYAVHVQFLRYLLGAAGNAGVFFVCEG